MRYLSQRYSNNNKQVCGILTDIGTEESQRNKTLSQDFISYSHFVGNNLSDTSIPLFG